MAHTRIVITNQRGGGAKTTNAVHLAIEAARDGLRVLAVDLDPQGHMSMSLSMEGEPLQFVDEALLTRKATPTPSRTPGLWVLPGRLRIHELFDTAVFSGIRWEESLLRILDPLKADFDLVVMDTPATFSKLHTVALRAADGYVISMRPEAFSVVGHDETKAQAEGFKVELGLTRPYFAGYILSGVPQGARRRAVERIRGELQEEARGRHIEIPLSVDFDECRWLEESELKPHRSIHSLPGTQHLATAYQAALRNLLGWISEDIGGEA